MLILKKVTTYFNNNSEKDLKGLFVIQNIQSC